jgi:2-methylisocitrate lyase-like PEP mutase family enzyme
LLPNAWDALSAAIFQATGYKAIATTSGGLAWALGFQDGEKTPWPEVVAATRRIARAIRVPLTADIEAGYGETPEQVARSITEIIDAGAVGVNLEDGTPDPQCGPSRRLPRVSAPRAPPPAPRTCRSRSMHGSIFI